PRPFVPSHPIPPLLFFSVPAAHRPPHSFPTRRSSDLVRPLRARRPHPEHVSGRRKGRALPHGRRLAVVLSRDGPLRGDDRRSPQDRKSTRLNSSHRTISYAVFCLKKKKDSSAQRRSPR